MGVVGIATWYYSKRTRQSFQQKLADISPSNFGVDVRTGQVTGSVTEGVLARQESSARAMFELPRYDWNRGRAGQEISSETVRELGTPQSDLSGERPGL